MIPVQGRLADALREHARNVKSGERVFKVGDASRFGTDPARGYGPAPLGEGAYPCAAHSFRHAFIAETRSIAGEADVKHCLTGHANGGGSERDIYGEQGLRVVREFIDRMWDGVAV